MKASPTLAGNMQAVLVDLIELHVQGKQAHWNIVGTNFRDLHLQLDEIIDAARTFADEMAERMRALHALPDGRSSTVSKTTALPEFPTGLINTKDAIEKIVAALEAAVGTMRKVHDEVDEEDPTTADLLHAFIAKLEQFAWLVNAETMRATASVTAPDAGKLTEGPRAASGAGSPGVGRCFFGLAEGRWRPFGAPESGGVSQSARLSVPGAPGGGRRRPAPRHRPSGRGQSPP